jgi:nicotinamidase-related amidase
VPHVPVRQDGVLSIAGYNYEQRNRSPFVSSKRAERRRQHDGFLEQQHGGSGADWLEQYKPQIEDGETIVVSPHKVYGPESNDLALQLRKRGIDKVVLAGMSANLCVESHLRELLEQGFEVAVVKDATAAAQHPELGDGYASALVNFGFIANAVMTTDEAVEALAGVAVAV